MLIFMFIVRRLENSRVGRAWLAVREDEDAAAVMGVNGFKFKLWAFAIGAGLGGTSGVLFASKQAYIDPTNFTLNLSVIFVAMVVVGGSGNIAGVALGAILLTYLPERFRELRRLSAARRRSRARDRHDPAPAGPDPEPTTSQRAA